MDTAFIYQKKLERIGKVYGQRVAPKVNPTERKKK